MVDLYHNVYDAKQGDVVSMYRNVTTLAFGYTFEDGGFLAVKMLDTLKERCRK